MNNYGGDNPYYGGAGGGYMATGSPYGSQGESPGKKVKSGNQTIRPVTVKQVLEATQVHHEADFSIDGVDVAQDQLETALNQLPMSVMRSEMGQAILIVESGLTQPMTNQAKLMASSEQDQYVCVFGTIKIFGGKRHVSANNIRRIEDPNEIQHHLLKALYVSLIHRGATRSAPDAVNNSTAGDYTASFQAIQDDQYAHLDPIQRKILQVIAQAGANSDDGVHVALVQKLVGDVNDMDLTEALDWLSENGHIYSTIDESVRLVFSFLQFECFRD
nr:hypothetical protein L204_06103 [Cryptococcus depauperatus CBS 7855]